jgi:hypothetical protein
MAPLSRSAEQPPLARVKLISMADKGRIVLDAPTRRTAKTLASRLKVSPSEAVRLAVQRYANETTSRPAHRSRRRAAFDRLVKLFEGHNADAEIRQRKLEDAHG